MIKTIYAGSEDRVAFFEELNEQLKLGLNYEVNIVDGEYEIAVYSTRGGICLDDAVKVEYEGEEPKGEVYRTW